MVPLFRIKFRYIVVATMYRWYCSCLELAHIAPPSHQEFHSYREEVSIK